MSRVRTFYVLSDRSGAGWDPTRRRPVRARTKAEAGRIALGLTVFNAPTAIKSTNTRLRIPLYRFSNGPVVMGYAYVENGR